MYKLLGTLIRKFEQTCCICDQLQSGRLPVSVEVVATVYLKIIEGYLLSTHAISRVLYLPNPTVSNILGYTFSYCFQCAQILQTGGKFVPDLLFLSTRW